MTGGVPRRYRVQKAWYFVRSLKSTSNFLRHLFEPFITGLGPVAAQEGESVKSRSVVGNDDRNDRDDDGLEYNEDDDEDEDDGLDPLERMWLNPPAEVNAALEDRARWLALVRMVSVHLVRTFILD